ncbi:hypothetical protein, partial [Mesorhizobium sp.]|uniref:hypothetical protein n=1 Tax=Mesorhizobium sp. TaxID=1871066 RepID=UPI0025C5DD92
VLEYDCVHDDRLLFSRVVAFRGVPQPGFRSDMTGLLRTRPEPLMFQSAAASALDILAIQSSRL